MSHWCLAGLESGYPVGIHFKPVLSSKYYGACMQEKLSTFAIELCQIIVVFSGCHPNFIDHAMSICLAARCCLSHRLDSLVTAFVLTSATVLSHRQGVAHLT